MGYLEFCSNCGVKNKYGYINGNTRYHCIQCNTIHYENPKPTVTLICPRNEDINYTTWTSDISFNWWFAPGSQLSFVWKNAIENEDNILRNHWIY